MNYNKFVYLCDIVDSVNLRIMKKLILLPIILFSFSLSAETVTYGYDEAGNRITREIVVEKMSMPPLGEISADVSEQKDDDRISVYPNPTYGEVNVEMNGYDNADSCMLYLFDMSGREILQMEMQSAITNFDISDCADGIFILRVILDGRSYAWKIIKK